MSVKKKIKKRKTFASRKNKYDKWYREGAKKHAGSIKKAKGLASQGKIIKQRLDKVHEAYEEPAKERVGLSYRTKSTNQLGAILGHHEMSKHHEEINKYSGIAKHTNNVLQKHDKFVRELTKGRGIHLPTFDHLNTRGNTSSFGTEGNFQNYKGIWGDQVFH